MQVVKIRVADSATPGAKKAKRSPLVCWISAEGRAKQFMEDLLLTVRCCSADLVSTA